MARNIRFTKRKGPPITGKCDFCGEKVYLPYQCKRCMGIFCDKHHFPENHSCVPISRIIKELKQFEEHNFPKSEEEEAKNKIDEINRIIITLQGMYESGEMGRGEYLDKIAFFNQEKKELEARLKQRENIGTNSQKESAFEEQNKELDNSNKLDYNKYYYTVDEKYRREYVGDINKANYSHSTHNLEDDSMEQITTKNRCQFCYNPIIGMPFKCYRCGLSYCVDHRLPEIISVLCKNIQINSIK